MRHRGPAQAGRAARASSPPVLARARHRHGRGRPRRPGRVAGRGGRGPAAHRPGRPPRRRAEHGDDLPEAPRRPARGRRRRRSACATARSRPPATRATRSTCWPSRSSPMAAMRRLARRRAGRRSCARCARFAELQRRAARQRARPARRPLPVATSSASCGPASSGTASPARSAPGDGAQRLAVTSGGTIPDRGLFGVFLARRHPRSASSTRRWSTRAGRGETFLLGASTWRIEDITHDRVLVTPAPGAARQDAVLARRPARAAARARPGARRVRRATMRATAAREARAGRARRALRASTRSPPTTCCATSTSRPRPPASCPTTAPSWSSASATRSATGASASSRPFGARVHAPWAMAIERRLTERCDIAGRDDVERRRHRPAPARGRRRAARSTSCSSTPTRSTSWSSPTLPQTALFAARFRECAARALLLPRRRPDQRTPLWQQRQRAADLLAVAPQYPSFPILLETYRECLQRRVRPAGAAGGARPTCASRRVRVVAVDTPEAVARSRQSLLFGWIAVYMYEGDAPLAERRAAALALDRDLLRDLLGRRGAARAARPRRARRRRAGAAAPRRRPPGPRSADELHDLLRKARGPRRRPRSDLRAPSRAGRRRGWPSSSRDRRAVEVVVAGEVRVDRRRGRRPATRRARVRLPLGLPQAFTDPVARSARVARGPLRPHARPVPRRGGGAALGAAARAGPRPRSPRWRPTARIVRGEFRPEGAQREWCDADVLRQLRRRSLAALRREIEPVEQDAYARFLPGMARHPAERRGIEALVESLGQLQGAAVVASALESEVLPARLATVPRRRPRRAVHGRRRALGRRRCRWEPTTVGCGCTSPISSPCSPRPSSRPTPRRAAARCDPGPARAARGELLEPAARRGAGRHGRRAARRAVGPGVGRGGHQRLARPAAGDAVRAAGRRGRLRRGHGGGRGRGD